MSDDRTQKSWHSLWVGLIFIAIALVFGVQAIGYDLGANGQVGPGFFPLGLSIILSGLGVASILQFRQRESDPEPGPVPWKAILLLSCSLAIFGYAGGSLGLVPVVFICTFIAALASSRNTILSAAAIAAAMTLLCFLVFKIGLGMTLPTFGPALGL